MAIDYRLRRRRRIRARRRRRRHAAEKWAVTRDDMRSLCLHGRRAALAAQKQ